jgi:hypothetical protein
MAEDRPVGTDSEEMDDTALKNIYKMVSYPPE